MLVDWPTPSLATRAVMSAVTVMNATLPRPEGPSRRARRSAEMKKPAEPTMFDAKKSAEP
jgi:hypothetical protein